MVMSAISLVERQPNLTGDDVRAQLDGNLCRCTGYHNIVKAVLEGAAGMKSPGAANADANATANANANANASATAQATA
jgi:carbon-monoxide dehydrogenase small subunit